ncbi:MAG: response regulator transcription factor [Solirubrobacterales bacterium]|nr:response regulator transcription factor [Solirubrobacterales bacterium]
MSRRVPNLDGLEAAGQILTSASNRARVIMLTTFDLDEYVYEALKVGASGFLHKDASPRAAAHVHPLRRRRRRVARSDDHRRLIERHAPPQARTGSESARLAELTPRELEVLTQVAHGRSNAEIAAASYLSEATVKTHLWERPDSA